MVEVDGLALEKLIGAHIEDAFCKSKDGCADTNQASKQDTDSGFCRTVGFESMLSTREIPMRSLRALSFDDTRLKNALVSSPSILIPAGQFGIEIDRVKDFIYTITIIKAFQCQPC